MDFEQHNSSVVPSLADGTLLQERWRILGTNEIEDSSILYDAMDIRNGDVVSIREYCPQAICSRAEDFALQVDEGDVCTVLFRKGTEEFRHIAEALRNVPYTEPVISCFEENQTCYYVRRKVSGKRLFEAAPLLTELYAQSLGVMLCDTFAALHNAGLFYGTISEEDLRFTPNGELRVGTDHLSHSGSAENDLRGLTTFLMSMLPIERDENPTAAMVENALRCSYRDAVSLRAALLGKKVTRKTARRTNFRGIAGLMLCVICLAGAVFGVKTLLSRQLPLTRVVKSGTIEPEIISVWAPMPENSDEKTVLAMYKKLAAGFERQNPGCGVDIKLYADGSFEDALALVSNGAEPPSVFMDTQDPVVLKQAADLTALTSSMKNVYITDLTGFGNSLPIGCSIPVLYYNTYSSTSLADSGSETIDFTTLPAGTLYDDSAAVFLEAQDTSLNASDCFTAFLEDARSPVLASSSCMAQAEHSGMASGAVQMLPVSVNGTFPVQYEMYCSVSSQVSENSRKIGMLWLQYLLTEEAQQILFVENYGDLPLHKNAFQAAVNVHSGMNSLKGLSLDSMMLQVRR